MREQLFANKFRQIITRFLTTLKNTWKIGLKEWREGVKFLWLEEYLCKGALIIKMSTAKARRVILQVRAETPDSRPFGDLRRIY